MSFAQLKKTAMSLSDLNELAEKDSNTKKTYTDDRFWRLTRDDAGNGEATIRFLPAPAGETAPWVKYIDYSFQDSNTNEWYFAKSLETLGQLDPVYEYNGLQWKDESGTEADIELRKKGNQNRSRNYHWVYNIQVIKDKNNPENNGKVKLYSTGSTIFNLVKDALNPKFEGQEKLPVFDLWKGADLNLRAYTETQGKRKLVKYDKTSFSAPGAHLDGDDKKLEALWNEEYSLQDLISADKFKSYDELKTKLYFVLGIDVTGKPVDRSTVQAPIASVNDGEPTADATETDAEAHFKKLAEEAQAEATAAAA